jgi:hypothetical protein
MTTWTLIGQLVVGVAMVSRVTCQSPPDESSNNFVKLTDEHPYDFMSFKERLSSGQESCYYHYVQDQFSFFYGVSNQHSNFLLRIIRLCYQHSLADGVSRDRWLTSGELLMDESSHLEDT